MGPSRSLHIDSYRAECSGMLSLLRYLVRLAEYADMYEPWHGVIGTDSQSMLDRLYQSVTPQQQRHPREFAVLDVLDPEWDLLVEIQTTLRRQLPRVTLQYVKGHQDNKAGFHLVAPQEERLRPSTNLGGGTFLGVVSATNGNVAEAIDTDDLGPV